MSHSPLVSPVQGTEQDTESSTKTAMVELELAIHPEMSEHEVASTVIQALETDDRVSVDFACTTHVEHDH